MKHLKVQIWPWLLRDPFILVTGSLFSFFPLNVFIQGCFNFVLTVPGPLYIRAVNTVHCWEQSKWKRNNGCFPPPSSVTRLRSATLTSFTWFALGCFSFSVTPVASAAQVQVGVTADWQQPVTLVTVVSAYATHQLTSGVHQSDGFDTDNVTPSSKKTDRPLHHGTYWSFIPINIIENFIIEIILLKVCIMVYRIRFDFILQMCNFSFYGII